MSSPKLSHEDFVRKAIVKLRDSSKSLGIHSVFSGFNQAFRDYFGENPVPVMQKLAESGVVDIRPVKGGVMIYLSGEAPQSRSELGKQALKRILDEPNQQQVDLVTDFVDGIANEVKQFPWDFLEKDVDASPLSLPGTSLLLEPKSQTVLVSPKRHFRYEAKNPPLAKFILYGYRFGEKSISVPTDSQVVFRAVTAYERYCKEIREKAFSFFLSRSHDEELAEVLTKEAQKRLGLRAGDAQ